MAYDQKYKFYGKSVTEFLDYYLNPDLTHQRNFTQRCGIIRHGINVDFETESFNTIEYSFSIFVFIRKNCRYYIKWELMEEYLI